jgi:hypothetical protein
MRAVLPEWGRRLLILALGKVRGSELRVRLEGNLIPRCQIL